MEKQASLMASYRDQLEAWAKDAGSDGCTVVPEFFRVCCLEHDHAYVHGETIRGLRVSKRDADLRFRECIQANSSFRWLSPLSWWRWLGVYWLGRGVWSERPTRLVQLYGRAAVLVEAERARRWILAELFPKG